MVGGPAGQHAVEVVAPLVDKIGGPVTALHSVGIVHGDIKLANIMLEDGSNEVKVRSIHHTPMPMHPLNKPLTLFPALASRSFHSSWTWVALEWSLRSIPPPPTRPALLNTWRLRWVHRRDNTDRPRRLGSLTDGMVTWRLPAPPPNGSCGSPRA
jgi:serine/threonine protein kinase